MATKSYIPLLLDADGYELGGGPECGNLKDAKAQARYLLSPDWAKAGETDHVSLGSHKVEVRIAGECVWDAFL